MQQVLNLPNEVGPAGAESPDNVHRVFCRKLGPHCLLLDGSKPPQGVFLKIAGDWEIWRSWT